MTSMVGMPTLWRTWAGLSLASGQLRRPACWIKHWLAASNPDISLRQSVAAEYMEPTRHIQPARCLWFFNRTGRRLFCSTEKGVIRADLNAGHSSVPPNGGQCAGFSVLE